MILALAVAIGTGWLIARWSLTDGFTVVHRIWLIGAALVGHSVFAIACGIADGHIVASPVIGAGVIAATLIALTGVTRRQHRTVPAETPRGEGVEGSRRNEQPERPTRPRSTTPRSTRHESATRG